MGVPGENIVFLLLAGLALGLVPGMIAERRGFRLIADIAVGVVAVFTAAWFIVPLRELGPPFNLLPGKPGTEAGLEEPNAEPVVLPLKTLRPLLKPVVYRSREEVCDALVQAAQKNNLPVHFFIRLLYQESSFRPAAISTAGALGIAQFMPETASDRRLDNPFDPVQAIPASARLLHDLYRKFGNLGLAAAAYNAGPKRVDDWRTNKVKGPLPLETQDYVRIVTGWPVETWSIALSGSPALKIPAEAPCQEEAGLLASDGPDQLPMPAADPRVKAPPHSKTARLVTAMKPAHLVTAIKTAHPISAVKDVVHHGARNRGKKPPEMTASQLERDKK